LAPSVLRVGGVVLCGGDSRRMGTAKAWLHVGDEYMLQRVVRIAAGVVSPVVIATRLGEKLPPLPDDIQRVEDAVKNGGPLAGIAAGLDSLSGQCDAAFVVSCDHPLLKPSFISQLIALLADHPAVVPLHEDWPYPLVAVYRVSVRAVLDRMTQRGELRARDFVKQCGARLVPGDEFRGVDPRLESLRNVNDRKSYESALHAMGL
jgi:molybdopterin-guanine dinucleotide biosynthesis protein A